MLKIGSQQLALQLMLLASPNELLVLPSSRARGVFSDWYGRKDELYVLSLINLVAVLPTESAWVTL